MGSTSCVGFSSPTCLIMTLKAFQTGQKGWPLLTATLRKSTNSSRTRDFLADVCPHSFLGIAGIAIVT